MYNQHFGTSRHHINNTIYSVIFKYYHRSDWKSSCQRYIRRQTVDISDKHSSAQSNGVVKSKKIFVKSKYSTNYSWTRCSLQFHWRELEQSVPYHSIHFQLINMNTCISLLVAVPLERISAKCTMSFHPFSDHQYEYLRLLELHMFLVYTILDF